MLEIGMKAPDFTLKDKNGNDFTLFDAIVEEAGKQGIELTAILCYNNTLYSDNGKDKGGINTKEERDGFVNYVKEPFWRGGHCYALSNISIDEVFLYHILKFNEASIMALRTGSGLPNIKKSTLANFCLKSPQSVSEQQAIATILTDMDDEIQALEAKRDKYTAIKQGMMQELLTGKIRLV